MRWFGNRNREGNETENIDVKPRNQILQTSLDKPTEQDRGKLDRFQDQTPEEQKKRLDNASKVAKDHQKLDKPNNTSSEGDPSIGQRELEKKDDPKKKLNKDDMER